MSKERDKMVSPDVQRTAIVDYCRARGYRLDTVVEGLDESGSRARSAWWPRLEQACDAVEQGRYDVVVCWKFSRVARHRLRWATAVDRVETAGGRIESATEGVDTTTSTGRFTRGMLAELQAFEAERIGEVWAEVHAQRVRNGRPATGRGKFGYAYDPDRKLHVPDPVTGPLLAEAYTRYVAGESVYSLVRWLNRTGQPTLNGGPWSDRTLRRVLGSGFASGGFRYHGDLVPGVHEPLITPALWQAYLDARERRRATPGRRVRSRYVLSGLVVCDRCGHPMVAGQFGNQRQPKYRCQRGKETGECPGGYVMGHYVERHVLAWLDTLAGDREAATVASLATRSTRSEAAGEARRLGRQRKATEKALTRLVVSNATKPLPAAVFDQARTELETHLADLAAREEAAAVTRRATPADPGTVARRLLAGWETRPVEHRRAELGTILGCVRVRTGRPRAVVTIVPVWDR